MLIYDAKTVGEYPGSQSPSWCLSVGNYEEGRASLLVPPSSKLSELCLQNTSLASSGNAGIAELKRKQT